MNTCARFQASLKDKRHQLQLQLKWQILAFFKSGEVISCVIYVLDMAIDFYV